MRWTTLIACLAFVTLLSCDGVSELEAEQGECSGLALNACLAQARCQQAYVDSAFSQAPRPAACLHTAAPAKSSEACALLTKDACRTRNDCTPIYWQELGPTDAPVGDPTYRRCDVEPSS
jgi:hypothetical protein